MRTALSSWLVLRVVLPSATVVKVPPVQQATKVVAVAVVTVVVVMVVVLHVVVGAAVVAVAEAEVEVEAGVEEVVVGAVEEVAAVEEVEVAVVVVEVGAEEEVVEAVVGDKVFKDVSYFEFCFGEEQPWMKTLKKLCLSPRLSCCFYFYFSRCFYITTFS